MAILWAPCNHYISRLLPFQENGFTGTWLYNVSVDGGAIGDCLVLMKSLRMRPTFVAPEDVAAGVTITTAATDALVRVAIKSPVSRDVAWSLGFTSDKAGDRRQTR